MSGAPRPPVQLGMERPDLVDDGQLRAGNASRGGWVARRVTPLRGRLRRFLQGCGRRLDADQALLLDPVYSVHSLGARQPLRVLFLDQRHRVLAAVRLAPWRVRAAPPGARAALLMRDQPNAPRAEPGDQIEWLRAQPRLPERAAWLDEGPEPP